MKYLLIIENAGDNHSAYFPDVPGCVTVGATVEAVKANALEALELHLEDEENAPAACSLAAHLEGGLELNGSEYITWVDYEPESAKACFVA